jgi:hypothetical protein
VQPSLSDVLLRRVRWIGSPLAKSEWDFRPLIHKRPTQLQRYELRAAVFYEYARESPTICELAERFSNLPRKLRDKPELSRWSNDRRITREFFFFTGLPFFHCIFWPKFFPKTPWLDIPSAERHAAVERYIERTSATLFEIKDFEDARGWEVSNQEVRRYKSSGIEHLLILINWAAGTNDQIIASFAGWVRNNRPAQFPAPRTHTSRQNVTDAFLTRLTVMRLLHNCSHDDALELAQTHGLKFPKQQSNALLMRQRVRDHIPLLFQSRAFQANTGTPLIPPTERPRSWQTVSYRRRDRLNQF